jgi:hypothetical protein
MIHEVGTHLQNNWHKYAVVFLILKDLYKFVSTLEVVQEAGPALSWLWAKIKKPFGKA